MKRIGITQRVERVKSVQNHSERRDCLDQRWAAFSWAIGYVPLPLSNILPDQVPALHDALKLDAVLLSGGNSVAELNPTADDAAPERDAFESALLDEALERNIPVIGICRGMQMINLYLEGRLEQVEGHVGVRHTLSITEKKYQLPETVNSFHNWGITPQGLAGGLKPIAFDSEGNVEAFQHIDRRLLGIMWHPERENPFDPLDIQLIKRFLK